MSNPNKNNPFLEGLIQLGEGMALLNPFQKLGKAVLKTPQEAAETDRRALESDWEAVGRDFESVITQQEGEQS